MRLASFSPDTEELVKMEQVYGTFDLDMVTGRPTDIWERRTMFQLRVPFGLQSAWFPSFWYRRIQVNRRASGALERVLQDLAKIFTLEEIREAGLDQFVRCYNFGGGRPSLFWYGAGWELSPKVTGDPLAQTIKLFVRHGWKYEGVSDKRRVREFEFW
jgi:hypothetical protein